MGDALEKTLPSEDQVGHDGERVAVTRPTGKAFVTFTPTQEQRRIFEHDPAFHARVLAGPGTGKSATLVALLDELLEAEKPPRVKLLTFTRAATGELAKKISEHPAAAAERPSTVHSFSISILLRNPGLGEFPAPLRLADDWEQDQVVYPTLSRRIGVRKDRLKNLFLELAANWESLRSQEHPKVKPEDRARFLGGWLEHREVFGYTLLAELPNALRIALRDHPDLVGADYDLLIVDEYQDLNACDLELLHRFADRACSIIGAGDDDQSIYSFRRAAPEGIRRFPEDYPDSTSYPLSITHRCGRRIIEWATFVIEGDLDRPERPRLQPADGSPPGEVALLSFPGEVSEAKGIARLVQRLVRDEEISPSDILILLRTDRYGLFSRPIKEQLEALEISYSDPDHVKDVLAQATNRRLLASARLLVNRTDSLAWAALLTIEQGIGEGFIDYLYRQSQVARRQLGQQLLAAYEAGFPDAPAVPANRARQLIAATLDWLESIAVPEAPEESWGHWLIALGDGDDLRCPTPEFEETVAVVDGLAGDGVPLDRYLNLITPLAKDHALTESPGVRIMTMAMSKGLTVEATIIAGLEHGLIPRPDGNLAEERRLLYVAMTRAKRFLYGTWARQRRGAQARAGEGRVNARRNLTGFLEGGPVHSQDGQEYLY